MPNVLTAVVSKRRRSNIALPVIVRCIIFGRGNQNAPHHDLAEKSKDALL
jgi:hypothetical protein